jgi:hypothetical protein
MNALEKLREQTDLVNDASADGLEKADAWTLAGRLLGRFPVDAAEAKRVLAEKDAIGLDTIVARLEHPAPKAPPPPPAGPVDEETLRHAMKAFRKRLKTARLADESKLQGRRLTGGKASEIDAIIPPTDYGPDVWRTLVARGELVDTGDGFVALPGDTKRV